MSMKTAAAGVFVLQNESTLVPMRAASFASEDDFQRLLESFPELLAGDQIDTAAPRRFLLVSREQPIASEEGGPGRWSLDHLFLDQDGIPTLVEVKRGTDTRIRREVVGQMLDYAANSVVHWPVEDLRARFEARCEAETLDAGVILEGLTGPEIEADTFWTQVKTNLQAGRIRMLFVADRIPTELRRIVEFLNGQMQPAEVLAVELRQYEGQGLKTLVPIVIGQTQEAAQKKTLGGGPKPTRVWDQDTVLAEIVANLGPEVLAGVQRIAEWTTLHADRVHFNTSPNYGSMGPVFARGGQPFYPFLIHTDGTLAIYFQYMIGRPVIGEPEQRQKLLDRLNAIPGISLPQSALTRRPGIPLQLVANRQTTDEFLAVMDWFIEQLPPA